MLEKAKTDLRISHNKLDADIQDNIASCELDLKRLGVNPNLDNQLVQKAIKLYLRWQYNFENQAERYMKAYYDLASSMSLSKDYKEGN
ncbi:hypothetical protein ABGF49_07745 [Helcococcus ovis]|uniref:phage head-tail connector protein n=1 Tax=Helcococcus TaxID=31983 RepID=UPI0038BBE1E7